MHSETRRRYLNWLTLILAAPLLPVLGWTQTKPVQVAIDASKTGAPISKYIYGQFLPVQVSGDSP